MVSFPKKERKSENLVKKLLKQQTNEKTEEKEIFLSPLPESSTAFGSVLTSSSSPNDTLSMIDELFTELFNRIFEEGENQERRISEESVGEEDFLESSEMDLELKTG